LIRVGQRLRVGGGAPISREREIYIVRRGDSLTHIASLYGIGLSELLRLNRLTVQSVIHPGQRLRIP
jgi:LysM repeat protein